MLVIKDGKVLMTKRKSKLGNSEYGTVGGHVEWGEHPMDTVKREAREELGIELGNLKFLDCASILMHGRHYIDITFTGEIISGDIKILEPEKIESAEWYALDSPPEPVFAPVRKCLEAYKTRKNYFEA